MYEHFNPHLLTDAWWQHVLMLIVAAILGYIIGYRSRKSEIDGLEVELANLGTAVDDCERSRKVVAPVVTAPVVTAPVVATIAAAAVVTAPVVAAAPVAAFVAPVVAAPVVATVSTKPDDLKVVEGIGPKIEGLLNDAGIHTFAELANTASERIKEILVAAGSRFQMHDPGTWPKQSAMARDGKFDELKKWQDELNKGKID